MKERSIRGKVPIYGASLELVITDDMEKSQKKNDRWKRLGEQEPNLSAGLTIWAGWNFCIMIDSSYLDHNIIAHECFHATHRIADWSGLKFHKNGHEEFAYLNGFLNNFVHKQLKEWKIRVK